MHRGRGSKGKNFTPLNSSSSHLLLIESLCLSRWSHDDSCILIMREAITRRSRSFPRWYILHRSFSISAVPPGQEKTDHRKRSRRRTRNYQMVIRKECYSDEIPYCTIQGCGSGGPRIHCIAYSLIDGLRDTIKEILSRKISKWEIHQ